MAKRKTAGKQPATRDEIELSEEEIDDILQGLIRIALLQAERRVDERSS